MTAPILAVSNLHKSFGSKKVLHEVTFELQKGEIFGFLGPNGAGKTTTVRIILGLVKPDQGSISINGFNIRQHFKRAISCVGAVVETPNFYSYLSGYQNIALIANLHPHVPKPRINKVLSLVGLAESVHDPVRTYSLGMKQRLGIARALIHEPKLIFLDEPMNGLDPQGIVQIRELIRTLTHEQGITFFITSHLLYEVEQICDRIAILKAGRIIEQGMVAELLSKGTEIVDVYTKETHRTYQILKTLEYIHALNLAENKISVELDKGLSSKLNQLLVSQNIMVDYLIPNNESLENLFIKLTQGEDHDPESRSE